jgi:hypothetical protein
MTIKARTNPGTRETRKRTAKMRKRAVRKTATVLNLVQSGVKRFILNDLPIGSLHRVIQAADRKGAQSAHPLTGSVFRRIVQRAIQERERRIRRILYEGHTAGTKETRRRTRSNDR